MGGIEQIQPLRISVRCWLLAAVLLALVAWPIPAAHAVTFTGPTNFAAGNFPQSIALGNINGDTDPDMVLVDQHPNSVGAGSLSVLTGAAGASFTGPTNINLGTTNPLFASFGEFNGDTDPDLAVASEGAHDGTDPGKVSILLGAAGSTFTGPTHFPAGDRPQGVAIADYNADGDPDLAVVNETPSASNGTVSILLGTTGSSFSAPTNFNVGRTPRAIVAGNFNGDADPDLAVANEVGDSVSILLGAAGGTFTGPTNISVCGEPTALAAGDFNGDSDPDLAVANELCGSVSVLLGGSGGAFGSRTDYGVANLPDAVTAGDFNADADPDLLVANQAADSVSILLGSAGGTFTGPTNLPMGDGPSAVAIANFNGDLDNDFAVTNEIDDTVSIMLGSTFAGFARPKSATPIAIRLVPSFVECTSPNAAHGAPLSSSSCSPPTQSSSFLTLHAPDRPAPHNTAASTTASLNVKLFCTDGAAPSCAAQSGDQQDVKLDSTITDVRCIGASGGCSAAGGTYSGKLLFSTTLRITDRQNGPSDAYPATVSDLPFQFGMQCSSGACNIATTADTVIPGLVQEGKRAIWQLSDVQVLDGGPDGNLVAAPAPGSGACPPACAGNDGESVFLRQGFFTP